jgi:ABC-2 type transport system ATP-binding protein
VNDPAGTLLQTEPASCADRRQPSDTPLAVETRSLRKQYGRFMAVADLTIDVRQGEVFGFLGPNGAGKTTSVKMLMGLVRPTSGTAQLLGRPLGDRDAKRRIGFLPELFRFHDWLTAEELLDFHGKLYGMSAAGRKQRIPEVLEIVGLTHRAKEPLRSYSKGMQQRAGLAQALLNDPLIVFLDEPTSALDPVGRIEVRNIILQLKAEGRSVFLNSHLLSEVETVCDRVAIINRGHVAAIGPMADLLAREMLVELRLGLWNESVEDALQRAGSVQSVRHEGDKTIIDLGVSDEEAVARTVDLLAISGVPVYGVTPHRRSLEDLFFEIVAGEGRSPER